MTNAQNTKNIKNSFNRIAEELGCVARLAGNNRKPEYQRVIGYSNGFEMVVKISASEFCMLVSKYPLLQN